MQKKRGLNLIITTSLIIIVSISLLIIFQIWSQALLKNLGKKTSALIDQPFSVPVLSVENDKVMLYFNSKIDANGVSIKVKQDDNLICAEIINVKRGENQIELKNCEGKVYSGDYYTILFITEKATIPYSNIVAT
ncbi:MAG: hypothetical protein ABGW69_02010 [Nanoarchaeota archaeon]